jgi:hypothetical protein
MVPGFMRRFARLALPLVALSTVLVATPASAAPDTRICDDDAFGGTYYCAYGVRDFYFRDGTYQIFVIGTNFSVYTRWRSQGFYSLWVNMGGQVRRTYAARDFGRITCGSQPIVQVVGTDNRWWSNARRNNGSWTGWNPGSTFVCPAVATAPGLAG